MLKNKVFLVIISLLVLGSCKDSGIQTKIGYLQIGQDVVLDVAKEGVFRALADSGFIRGQNLKVIDNNAQGDLSLIMTILQSFEAQGVDLIITNGTPCMVAAAQTVRDIPVVFTVSFGPGQMELKSTPSNLYGVYDPMECDKVVDMICEIIPDLKRVGIPYNNSEPNAAYSVKVFSAEFEKRNIEMVLASVNSTNDLVMIGEYLAGQNIDAFLVTADNLIYRGLNTLSKIAVKTKIPLFVTDALQVEKGAAVGMGINYEKWGYFSGLKAVEILRERTPAEKIEPLTDLELIVNRKACLEQGMTLPQSLLERATIIQ